MPEPWTCPECENECQADEDVCSCCDCERPPVAEGNNNIKKNDGNDDDEEYKNICVGKVLECEDVSGGKAKKLSVDVGDGTPLTIATTASNVTVGMKVVVAKVGAVINDETIKTCTVYSVGSQGMLCDNVALNWKGGGSGPALVPDSFQPGDKPPSSRPRMA